MACQGCLQIVKEMLPAKTDKIKQVVIEIEQTKVCSTCGEEKKYKVILTTTGEIKGG